MSVIQKFRDKVKDYEGYAKVWIVSRKVALATHGGVFLLGLYVGHRFWH